MLNANLISTRQGNKKENVDFSFLEAPYGAAGIFCEQYVVSGAPNGAHILNAPTADQKTEIHTAFSISDSLSCVFYRNDAWEGNDFGSIWNYRISILNLSVFVP